jgi:hypothetical protein
MTTTHLGAAVRDLDRLFQNGTIAASSDERLLERFLAGKGSCRPSWRGIPSDWPGSTPRCGPPGRSPR